MSCQGDVPTGQICAPMERCGSLNGSGADLLVERYTLIAEVYFSVVRGCFGLKLNGMC